MTEPSDRHELLLAECLSGERSTDDPEVRELLAQRPDLAAEIDALRELGAGLRSTGSDWRADLDTADTSGEGAALVAAIDARVAVALAAHRDADAGPVRPPLRPVGSRPRRARWAGVLAVAAAAVVGVWLWSEIVGPAGSGGDGRVPRVPLDEGRGANQGIETPQRSQIIWLGPDVLDSGDETVTIAFRPVTRPPHVYYQLGLVDPSDPTDERLLPRQSDPRFEIPAAELEAFGDRVLVRAYEVAPDVGPNQIGERDYAIR